MIEYYLVIKILNIRIFNIKKNLIKFYNFAFIIWGLGIGDWGLGIG